MLHQWPRYVAYLAAFLNISSIWISHHDLFTRVRRVDARLICANLLVLMVAWLFPWPASVVAEAIGGGDHHDQVAATTLYAAIGFLVPVAWIVLYRCVERSPQLLIDPGHVDFARSAIRRATVSVVVFPLAAALALVSPVAALVALPLFFIGRCSSVPNPQRRERTRPVRTPLHRRRPNAVRRLSRLRATVQLN